MSASNVFAQLTADPSVPVSAFHNQLTATQAVQAINHAKFSTLMRLWSCLGVLVVPPAKPIISRHT